MGIIGRGQWCAMRTLLLEFYVALSALLCSRRFLFLHCGDGTARADFGKRPHAGFVAGGISGLPAPLATVSGGCDGDAARSRNYSISPISRKRLGNEPVKPGRSGCAIAFPDSLTSGFYDLSKADTRIITWNAFRQIDVEPLRPQ